MVLIVQCGEADRVGQHLAMVQGTETGAGEIGVAVKCRQGIKVGMAGFHRWIALIRVAWRMTIVTANAGISLKGFNRIALSSVIAASLHVLQSWTTTAQSGRILPEKARR
jgi:hypothetical protein